MRKLLITVSIVASLKVYSQPDKIHGSWSWIDDSSHKFAVQLIFRKDSTCELILSDIPTTHYTRIYGTFKVNKDTLFIKYQDSIGINKVKILSANILQIFYLKGKHVDLIDDKTFFKVDLPKN